ncbi:hypothetical protein BEN30_10875 [Magnetovibrio blakemorei]|uniref:Alpha/beta hydrolase n=2 Tax=Magnetovibrio blakemorei TaxID=28181 RepID=A0A1E5Q7C9_9PROT|nr:hypothetical protein BEN30_10875 [Magnetovibrio blakemorei]
MVPGLGGSDSGHWQTHWHDRHASCEFVQSVNWNLPERESWLAGLDLAIHACATPPLLVAHSLGCALVAHWVAQAHKRNGGVSNLPVRGALLVAPADVDSEAHTPAETHVFAPMPLSVFPFPSTVVASTNDPYVDPVRAKLFATAWGAEYTNVGPRGHINADSHLGDWQEGWDLLTDLYREDEQLSRA